VVWRGYRFGEDLAAHFASADCFVFPSRTETFGNVILEAFASGLPVASVPAPGPIDLVKEGVNGAIDDELMQACFRALRCSRTEARASILGRTLRAGHDLFRDHLMPLDPNVLVPDRATLAAWPAVRRVSADGLYPAALARGGSKGPSEGPFPGEDARAAAPYG
jgi:hypothetical protein